MTMAAGLAAGSAIIGRRQWPAVEIEQRGLDRGRLLAAEQLHLELGGGQDDAELHLLRRAEAEIDVIPGDGGVATELRRGAGHRAGMGMALEDGAAGFQRD